MSVKKNEWHYLDEDTNQWNGPVTLAELDGLRQQGRIHEFTQVVNTQMAQRQGPMSSGVPYSRISRLAVEFDPSPENFLASRDSQIATVLSGPNNCGKTLLLRQLFALLDHDAYLIQCNRFSHVDVLNTRQQEEHEHRRYYDNFLQNFHTSQQNTEDNELRLEQVITGLKDSQLDKLFQLSSKLLGNEFSLKRSDPESRFSPYYVDMDGENLRYGSSGTRLLITLLGILFDERFSVILIDEPEIGLSPKIQAALARFLFDKEQRKDFCPHLRQVFVATHSHLFLDRNVISNNFTVMKEKTIVTVQQVQSLSALHQLQFNLLGNELESVFLPSAILIVEGTSDETFLARIMQLHIPDRRITIVRAGGDGEISKKLNVLKEALGDLFTSPYHDRALLNFKIKGSAIATLIFGRKMASNIYTQKTFSRKRFIATYWMLKRSISKLTPFNTTAFVNQKRSLHAQLLTYSQRITLCTLNSIRCYYECAPYATDIPRTKSIHSRKGEVLTPQLPWSNLGEFSE